MGHHEVFKTTVRVIASSVIGLVLIFSLTGTAGADELRVPIDETKAFVLEDGVATVAVTNPSIADVSVHNNKIILVIGRTFGTTNLIALDADGKPVATKRIRVISTNDATAVTYVRGPGILSYSCAPRCERVVFPGDSTSLTGPAAPGDVVGMAAARDSRAKSASE